MSDAPLCRSAVERHAEPVDLEPLHRRPVGGRRPERSVEITRRHRDGPADMSGKSGIAVDHDEFGGPCDGHPPLLTLADRHVATTEVSATTSRRAASTAWRATWRVSADGAT